LAHNLKVVGSNPTPETTIIEYYQNISAQWGAFCV